MDAGRTDGPQRRHLSRRAVIGAGAAGLLATTGVLVMRRRPEPDRQVSYPGVVSVAGPGWYVHDLALSPDGRLLTASTGNGSIWLWEVAARRPSTRQPRAGYQRAGEAVFDRVTFNPDGSLLAFNDSRDRTVHLWDVAAGRPAGPPITGRSGELHGLQFSPDGATLAAGDASRVQLWDVAGRRLVGELGPDCSDVVFSPDGKLIATRGVDRVNRRTRTVQIWNVATRRRVGEPITSSHTGEFTFHRMAFSPRGALIATHDYRSVRFWDVATRRAAGAPIAGVQGPQCCAPGDFLFRAVAFTPDGRFLATSTAADGHGIVRLWNVETREPVPGSFAGATDSVSTLAFDRAGRLLAIADGPTVHLWTLPGR